MSILPKLLQGSLDGVPFLFNSNRQVGGRKSATYEYPNRNDRTVTDLGELLPTYTMVCVITGQLDEYFDKRNAFIRALSSSGSKQLIHPIDGDVRVFCKPYTLNESIDKLGYAEFNCVFETTSDPVYPTESESKLSRLISQISNTISTIEQDINNTFSTINYYKSYINYASTTILNMGNILNAAALTVLSDTQTIYPIQLAINSLSGGNNATINAFDSNKVSQLTNSVLDSLTSSGNNSTDSANAMAAIAKEDIAPIPKNTTILQNDKIKARNSYRQLLNAQAFVYLLRVTVSETFSTEEDINKRTQLIDELHSRIINNNIFRDINDREIVILNAESLENIANLNVIANGYLREQRTTAKTINTIYVQRSSIIPLVYSLYGNLDNLETLYRLNDVGDPTDISGEFKILTS